MAKSDMLTFKQRLTTIPGVSQGPTHRPGMKAWRACIRRDGVTVFHKWFGDDLTAAEQAVIDWHQQRGEPLPLQNFVPGSLLAELDPELNNEVLVPIRSGSGRKLWWRCSEGHQWQTKVISRTQGHGCSYCARVAILPETAVQIMREGGLEPLEPYPGSFQRKWRATCDQGHEVTVRLGHIQQGRRCPLCAERGFNTYKPGWIYLVRNAEKNAWKIGISNHPEKRLRSHAGRFGFEVTKVWGPMDGTLAVEIERKIVDGWRRAGFPSVLSTEGFTESVSCDLVTERSVVKTVNRHLGAFDAANYYVRPASWNEARPFVSQWHYSGTLPAATQHLFGMYDKQTDKLVGVAAFGSGTYPGVASGYVGPIYESRVLELRRLCLVDQLGRNAESWFLARCLKRLPAEIAVVVAHSDPAMGHLGTIYQASNFLYVGTTAKSYHYEDGDGNYIHKRNPWNQAQRRGVSEKEQAEALGLVKVMDPPKHRYIYVRDPSVVILRPSVDYPKKLTVVPKRPSVAKIPRISVDTQARLITAYGETKTISQWAEDSRCQVTREVLARRISLDWDAQKALEIPPDLHKSRGSPLQDLIIRVLQETPLCSAEIFQATLAQGYAYKTRPEKTLRGTLTKMVQSGLLTKTPDYRGVYRLATT